MFYNKCKSDSRAVNDDVWVEPYVFSIISLKAFFALHIWKFHRLNNVREYFFRKRKKCSVRKVI